MLSRLIFTILFLSTRVSFLAGINEQAVVRAVLFYSPTCGHCHLVIQETLPALMAQYGEQLDIIGIDVTQPDGQAFFRSAIEMFGLESTGVPFLVVGNEYLVGSSDIPNKFPALIDRYLAEGGVDWPDIPGLRDAIYTAQTSQAPTPTAAPATAAVTAIPTVSGSQTNESATQTGEAFALPNEIETNIWQRVMLDPLGNGLAIVVLLCMIFVVINTAVSLRRSPREVFSSRFQLLIPVLCAIGLGVAGYLAYVETTQTTAVCGPVGDCNTVQQSEYARLFGILPIGVLGLAGYIAILIAWLLARYASDQVAHLGSISILAMTACGTLFSIYLTFLEPFVIGATCVWCLTSAVVMTVLMLLSVTPARIAVEQLRSQSKGQ